MTKIFKLFSLFIGCFFIVNLHTKKIIKFPYVSYNSIPYCVVHNIEIDELFTKVSLYYRNPYSSTGWVNFSRTTTLKDLGCSKIYNIIYTEGVPLSPQKKNLKSGEGVYCSLFFPPIPNDSKYIEIYENVENGFHFVIQLKSDFKRYSSQYDVMNSYINKKLKEENQVEWNIKQKEIYDQNSVKHKPKKEKKRLVKDPDFKVD